MALDELRVCVSDFTMRSGYPVKLVAPAHFAYVFKLNREMRVYGIDVIIDNFIMRDGIILIGDTGLTKSYKMLSLQGYENDVEVNKLMDTIASGIEGMEEENGN